MATISASFTAVDQVSTGLLVPEGQTATCGASGTYAASILLERTRDGGQTWETITTSSTPNATVSQVVTDPGTYRWRCDAFTSGTVAVTLANEVAILFGPIRNAAGEVMFEVTTDGVTTDGTATGFGAALTGFTGASNTGLGTGAGGDVAFGENVSVGKNAAAGVRGSDNTVVGFGAMGATTNVVSRNVAIGATALGNGNVSAGQAVGVGYETLASLTSGAKCTAVGYQALTADATGSNNTAVGHGALSAATGDDSTAVGQAAAGALTSGVWATAVGVEALKIATTGNANTAIGWHAGNIISTGSVNTLLGARAGDEITTGTNNTAIGYRAGQGQGNVSNKFMVSMGDQGIIFSVDEGLNLLNISVRYADGTMKAITGLPLT